MPGWYKSADIMRQNLRGGKLPRSLLAAEDLLKSLDEINTHVPVEDLIECVKAHVEEKLMCGAEGTPPPTRLNMNNSVFNSPPPGLLDPGFDPLFLPAAQRRTLDPASLQRRPKTVRLIGFKYQFLKTACDPKGKLCHHFKVTDDVKRVLPHFLAHGDPSVRVPFLSTRDGDLILVVKERDKAGHGKLIEDRLYTLWVEFVLYTAPITQGYYARILWNNSKEVEILY